MGEYFLDIQYLQLILSSPEGGPAHNDGKDSTYVRWLLRTRCARVKLFESFLDLGHLTAFDLNK